MSNLANGPTKTLFALQQISSLATFGAITFWGIGFCSMFHFFFDAHMNGTQHRRPLRMLVWWIGVVDTVRQGLSLHSVVKGGGILWGDEFAYYRVGSQTISFGDTGMYLASALVAIPAQTFFIYRMWQLYMRPIVVPVAAAPALVFQLVFPIILIFGRDITLRMPFFIATIATCAALDTITCVGLTSLLWRRYLAGTSRKSTISVLLRLILLSVNTGSWTTIVSIYLIVTLIVTVRAHEQPPLGAYHLISPLYFATVLINLNSRQYIRDVGSREATRSAKMDGLKKTTSIAMKTMSSKSNSTSSTRDTQSNRVDDSDATLRLKSPDGIHLPEKSSKSDSLPRAMISTFDCSFPDSMESPSREDPPTQVGEVELLRRPDSIHLKTSTPLLQ